MTHDVTVLVVGSGGREHAIASKVAQSSHCKRLLVAPGNAGTPGERHNVAVTDVQGMVALCKQQHVDLVIIGPEAALDAGLTDALYAIDVKVFGPTQQLSMLESSKIFSRQLAQQLNLSSPHFAHFPKGNADAAIAWCATFDRPIVVKQSGLAGGKGVVVPESIVETHIAIREAIAVGDIVLEERLIGTEVSLIALCDGITSVPLPLAQDHKRVGEGDTGANTGGMGAYSPLPWAPTDIEDDVYTQVLAPMIAEMAARGTPFIGLLYAGLALTDTGLKVIEFNARFGDPETQVLIPRLQTPLASLLYKAATDDLDDVALQWRDNSAVTVVLAAPGYPANPIAGGEISELPTVTDTQIFHAGTKSADGKLLSSGGRVLTVTGIGSDLTEARNQAYRAISQIKLTNSFYRTDIALNASVAEKGN